jgi:hypothetical protein
VRKPLEKIGARQPARQCVPLSGGFERTRAEIATGCPLARKPRSGAVFPMMSGFGRLAASPDRLRVHGYHNPPLPPWVSGCIGAGSRGLAGGRGNSATPQTRPGSRSRPRRSLLPARLVRIDTAPIATRVRGETGVIEPALAGRGSPDATPVYAEGAGPDGTAPSIREPYSSTTVTSPETSPFIVSAPPRRDSPLRRMRPPPPPPAGADPSGRVTWRPSSAFSARLRRSASVDGRPELVPRP